MTTLLKNKAGLVTYERTILERDVYDVLFECGSNFRIPGHFFSCINLLLPCSCATAVEWVNN